MLVSIGTGLFYEFRKLPRHMFSKTITLYYKLNATGGVILMNDFKDTDLNELKQQLALTRLQDKILEDIENQLSEIKEIAEYAAGHQLTVDESARFNERIQQHQKTITALEEQLLQTKAPTELQ